MANKYLGVSLDVLEKEKERCNISLHYAENALTSLRESFKEKEKGYKFEIKAYSNQIKEIEEAIEYAKQNKDTIPDEYFIRVHAGLDRVWDSDYKPKYVGDLGPRKTVKIYKFELYKGNTEFNKFIFSSEEFSGADKKGLKRELERAVALHKNVKFIELDQNCSLGMKEFEDMGIKIIRKVW